MTPGIISWMSPFLALAVALAAQCPAMGQEAPASGMRIVPGLPDKLESAALEAYSKGDYYEAACILERAIQASPEQIELLKYLAYCYTNLAFAPGRELQGNEKGSWDPKAHSEAEKALNALLAYKDKEGKDPRLPGFLDELCDSPILEEAVWEILRKREKDYPSDPFTWETLAKMYNLRRETNKAFEAAKRWQDLVSEDTDALLFQGKLILRRLFTELIVIKEAIPSIEQNYRAFKTLADREPDSMEALEVLRLFAAFRAEVAPKGKESAAAEKELHEIDCKLDDRKECLRIEEAVTGAPALESTPKEEQVLVTTFPEYLPLILPSYFDLDPWLLKRDTPRWGECASRQKKGPLPIGSIKPPRPVREIRPQYPLWARLKGTEGRVAIELILAPSGRVLAARVIKGSDSFLDYAALDAVTYWRFSPPTVTPPDSSQPHCVAAYHIVMIIFKLR